MSLPAAASGLVVLLLTVPVIQGQNGWGVTYTPPEICAFKGSTVEISCTIRYPSRINGLKVDETFWFTKESNGVYVDLRTDPQYSGRVTSRCEDKVCSLMISDLRESDSAEYKFRFTTNQPGGTYTGSPGVSLSVTDLQMQVNRFLVYNKYYNWAELTCQSSCLPPGGPHYVWYKNGQNIWGHKSYSGSFYPADSVSCAVGGHEAFHSPSVLIQSQKDWRVTYTPTELCAFKGSTVNLRCSYTYPSTKYSAVQKTFWFTKEKDGEPVDLTSDSEYSRRAWHHCDKNDCTLMITDLRESDSAEYKFRFTTNQPENKYTGSPGFSLSVTDPQLQIKVRRSTVHLSPSWTELTCHTKCQLPEDSSYIWYQNGEERKEETVYFHPHPLNTADSYSCAIKRHEMFPSPSVYAPKLPSVSVSPSAEIVEGSSVTLTCSSDANPAANYTWYKEDEDLTLFSEGPQLVFSSIQSSDSGQFNCTAENQLGRKSTYVSVNVKYAPKLPSVSVSPSAEIVEGSSVTLTCSSDANPAANYTWYKEDGKEPLNKEPQLVFSSIQSSDSGQFYCTAENQLGRKRSTSISIDVEYAPKLPSVSVSPSAEIVEGSSVNLTCSSDANPAANYIWYQEDEDSPKASGQIFIITNFTAEHSGNYSCEAQNTRGRRNATVHVTVVAGNSTSMMSIIRSTLVVLMLIPLLLLSLWTRKKTTLSSTTEPHEPEEIELDSFPEYQNVSDIAAQTEDTEEQEDQV